MRAFSFRDSGAAIPPESAIEVIRPPQTTIGEILNENPAFLPLDLLQVDVESLDDQIILNSINRSFLPKLVNFEVRHLSRERIESVEGHLNTLGYVTAREKGDMLAILKGG